MPPVTVYAFHDLRLFVEGIDEAGAGDLERLLDDLSWSREESRGNTSLRWLRARIADEPIEVPASAREVVNAEGLRVFECGDRCYVADDASVLRVDGAEGRIDARLGASFSSRPTRLRREFWTFGLLKLLRSRGIFGLHAAGLKDPGGRGVLIVGESGSGKSTLTIALIRMGWSYLSDDAVLLRSGSEGVEALALRRNLFVDASAEDRYSDLRLAEGELDRNRKPRRRIDVEASFPSQRADACIPRVLLFPRVVEHADSRARRLDRREALRRLLAQSGSQLFDRFHMDRHLALLTSLLRQVEPWELLAGRDVLEDPAGILRALSVEGDRACLVSSSS